ncbi:hypothetical protein NJ76_06555 [Rhodococcus sp. IITR03]|nr:hypothetical protein NJ76_06555 [Rhodococcus sp. IITR03]
MPRAWFRRQADAGTRAPGGSGRRAAPAVPIRDSSSFVVGGLYLHGSAAKMQPDPDLVRFDGSVRLTGLL